MYYIIVKDNKNIETYKNHPADRSLKEDLSIDTTFDPSYISWDTPFKQFNPVKDAQCYFLNRSFLRTY